MPEVYTALGPHLRLEQIQRVFFQRNVSFLYQTIKCFNDVSGKNLPRFSALKLSNYPIMLMCGQCTGQGRMIFLMLLGPRPDRIIKRHSSLNHTGTSPSLDYSKQAVQITCFFWGSSGFMLVTSLTSQA